MKKGISPIVAVVLLIAIAVIAAVGLYFWVGGLATKQPTPNPPKTITAYAVQCGTGAGNTTIMISNTSPPGTTPITVTELKDSVGNGFVNGTVGSTGTTGWECDTSSLGPGNSMSCTLNSSDWGAGKGTIAIYGNSIAAAQVTC